MTNARFWAGTSVMRYKSDLRPGAERLAQYYDQFGRLLLADSVEKVAPPSGLRQNLYIGQQGSTQHDGTVIEWAGTTVLLIQP